MVCKHIFIEVPALSMERMYIGKKVVTSQTNASPGGKIGAVESKFIESKEISL